MFTNKTLHNVMPGIFTAMTINGDSHYSSNVRPKGPLFSGNSYFFI